jgi:hypothetical protein
MFQSSSEDVSPKMSRVARGNFIALATGQACVGMGAHGTLGCLGELAL